MKNDKTTVRITVCSVALAGVAFATDASAACSRQTLVKLADTYVKAQAAGDASKLSLAKGASYTENDKAMPVIQGGRDRTAGPPQAPGAAPAATAPPAGGDQ